ncbi:MAG: hypothetical protein Q9201_006454 [Fulgogasparrea decipioides]
MSSKRPPSTPMRPLSDVPVPPPPYSEILEASPPPNPIISRVSTLIDSHILPHLNDSLTTALVLVPSNVTPLICASESSSTKDTLSFAFPGEKIVGFDSEDTPTVIRLVGADNRLDFWQRAAVIRALENELRGRFSAQGYKLVNNPPKAKSQAVNRIAGSKDADWKYVEQESLSSGEIRINVEISEVCLRIESEVGLYQTRNGKAIVVRMEFGMDEEND